MLFHLFLLVLIIFTLFFFYTDVMNKINTNKPFAEGMANAAPSGFKYVSSGQPVGDISQEECKTFTDKLDGYSFSVINESGNPKGCMLQDGTPPGSKGVYYNTGGTADCGAFNVSKCVVKDTVGAPNGYTYTGESQCQDWNSHYVVCQTALDGTSCSIKATTIDECAAECNKRDSCGEMYFKNGVCYLADGKCVPQTNPTNPQPHYKKGSSVNAPSQTGQQSLVTFDNWRKKYLGSQVETEVSSDKPYGSIVADWDECKNVLNTNLAAKQVVYSKSTKACYPMKEKSEEDQDGKGGTNMDWTSAQLLPSKYGAPASAVNAGMNITSSTKETSSIDPTTGAKVTEKCVTVSQLDSASKWVDHLFGTLSNTKCADKDKVMAAKTASKTDFIAGVIKGYQNDRQSSTDYYMSAIDKAKPMLDAAFDVNTQNVATANSQHPLLQGGEGGEEGIEDAPNQHSLAEGHTQNNVTANMANGSTEGLDQHSSVPSVTTLEDQLKQTPAYQQAVNQISNKNGNYEMANGNLVQPATGSCPNGCKAPQYDNEKCTNQMIGGKAYRSCPWIGDGSINDSMCKDCGSILMPKNEYGYARTRPGLFSKNTLHNLLAGRQFNKEPEKPNTDYVNIGLQFMTELSMARNFRLPYIPQEKYETIGKIVHKYQLNHNSSADSKKDLSNIINGVLNSDKIPTTINSINNGGNDGNSQLNGAVSTSIQPNEDAFTLQNTLNEPSTNEDTKRSEKIIKGLMGADNYYKSASQGAAETQGDNRLGGSKTLFDQSKKHSGYTTKYRPQDPRHRPKPYDSIWELFKQ